jgi:hypothetical protein
MAETKYGKHIMKAPIGQGEGAQAPLLFFAGKTWGVNLGIVYVPILKPMLMVDEPHAHDFDQFVCFLGSDPNNIGNLDAEIELSLGEEGEKHVITTPSIVHFPKGLVHCPLNYKRVDKPVCHLDVFLAPEYTRKPRSK